MNDDGSLFDRSLLRQRRARFAHEFDARKFLFSYVAQEITERIDIMLRDFPRALDLGAYAGQLGTSVGALSSVGKVTYAESVFDYAARAPRPSVVCDEDLLPFKDESFNLIVSGLALHRVNDLPGSLVQIRRALKPDGLFIGAALGAGALIELRECLIEAESEMEGGASPRISPFGDVRAYGALLQRTGFALAVADAEDVCVTYENPRDLMREIRALGGGNVLRARSKAPLPRRVLLRAEEIYRARFGTEDGKVKATFQFVFMSGWGPDASQQQPLRPGSAKARLAEALKTQEHSAGDKASFPKDTSDK